MKPTVSQDRIDAFCRRWNVRELALFGSVVGDDFRRDSDVDVMVSFDPASSHTLFDIVDMKDELKEIFGRELDLLQKEAVRNPFVNNHIRRNRRIVYRASRATVQPTNPA